MSYVILVFHITFFLIAGGILLYNMVSHREIEKGVKEIGVVLPQKTNAFLLLNLFLSIATIIVIGMFIAGDIYYLLSR